MALFQVVARNSKGGEILRAWVGCMHDKVIGVWGDESSSLQLADCGSCQLKRLSLMSRSSFMNAVLGHGCAFIFPGAEGHCVIMLPSSPAATPSSSLR